MSARTLGLLTRACIAGIILGILGMIQPWIFDLFRYAFLLLLIATVAYTVISHLPVRSSAAASTEVLEQVPIALGAAENPTSPTNTGGAP